MFANNVLYKIYLHKSSNIASLAPLPILPANILNTNETNATSNILHTKDTTFVYENAVFGELTNL